MRIRQLKTLPYLTIHCIKEVWLWEPSVSKSYTNSWMQPPELVMGKTVTWSGEHFVYMQ